MATIPLLGNDAVIMQVIQSLYGVAPGYNIYSTDTAYLSNHTTNEYVASRASAFSSYTNAQFADLLMTNTGLKTLAASNPAALQTSTVTAYLDAVTAGASNVNLVRGVVALQLAQILSSLATVASTDERAMYVSTATTFNNTTSNAYTYSTNSANTASGPVPGTEPGQTLALTTGADSYTGGSSNDVFNAGLSAGVMTFDAQDQLSGGAGNDLLNVTGINGTVQPALLSSIETIHLTSTAATSTISLLGATGVTEVDSYGSTAAAAFTNIQSAGMLLGVYNTSSNATFTFTDAALSGTADAAALTVTNVTGGTVTVGSTAAANGFETIGITSSGSANTITLDDGAASSLVTVNVAGSQNLALTITPNTVTTINAATMTGGLTVSAVAAASSITGGSGNDTITMSIAGADSVVGGDGNDEIIYTGNFGNTDTVNGGNGTDTLTMTSAQITTTTKVSNIEIVKISNALGAALTTANIQAGITTVDLAGGTGTFAVTMEAGAKTVKIGAANTGTLTVNDTGTATNDSLTITNTAAATDVFAGQNLTVAGYETVTFSGTGTGAATTQSLGSLGVTADTGGTATVNFTGSNTFSVGAITANVISASGLTGSAKLTQTTNSVGATTITGSANDDTLYGAAATATSIDGGDGKDTIVAGSGNDTLIGGAGNDTITSGAGTDTISAGDGNDTITMGANLTAGDTIDGGAGTTDTVSITNASVTTLNGLGIGSILTLNNNISNVERWIISDALNQGANFDLARLDSATYVTLTGITGNEGFTSVANNSTFVLTSANNANTDILSLVGTDVTGSADSVTLSLVNNASTDFGVVDASGFETITLTSAEATASSNVRVQTVDFTDTSLKTLTVSGTESVDLSGAALYATTVNASGLTAGYIKVSSANATANVTMTGSDVGADTMTGGAGDDTISGFGGADSLVGGSGNDTITGGEAGDTIQGGVGNDSIVLTETTHTADKVEFTAFATNGTDTITGFDMTNLDDVLEIAVADATNGNAGGGAGAIGANVFTLSSTAVNAANEIIVLVGATYGNVTLADAAVDAYAAATITATDDVTVIYTDGTDAWVIHDANAGTANGAADITVMAKLVGISTTAQLATLTAANFAYI